MQITKADGSTEPFKPNKLRASLRRAGASKKRIAEILREIEADMTDGMTTQAIYRRAFDLLAAEEKPIAAKYSLRRALFGLGPTGFPFEDFLSRLFEREGYRTKTRLLMKGKCVTHEIDVAAYSDTHNFVVEAKFHARPGTKSDLQVALYSYARYLDLTSNPSCKEENCGLDELYLVTNTKFTKAAETYAECVGLTMIGWNYPKHDSLRDRIERAGLYPVTALSTLGAGSKRMLLENGIILCKELLAQPDILQKNGLSHKKMQAVIDEARQLCGV